MKNGKKLNYEMKKLLSNNELNAHDWLYVKNEPKKLTIIHRRTKEVREIEK